MGVVRCMSVSSSGSTRVALEIGHVLAPMQDRGDLVLGRGTRTPMPLALGARVGGDRRFVAAPIERMCSRIGRSLGAPSPS
jgi:hypothetical protein